MPSKLQANDHLTVNDIESTNKKIKLEIENAKKSRETPVSYTTYSDEERAEIARYTNEHGPTTVSKHFSKSFRFFVTEASARCFKKEYLHELKECIKAGNTKPIKKLPTKHQEQLLLFQEEADCTVLSPRGLLVLQSICGWSQLLLKPLYLGDVQDI